MELDDASLPIGAFGENFTIDDFDEQSICIGDRLTVGSAQLVVTQPRLPCHKLALHFSVPFSFGGSTTTANLELRCRAHNLYEARELFDDAG